LGYDLSGRDDRRQLAQTWQARAIQEIIVIMKVRPEKVYSADMEVSETNCLGICPADYRLDSGGGERRGHIGSLVLV
jgi:hypothetical protein